MAFASEELWSVPTKSSGVPPGSHVPVYVALQGSAYGRLRRALESLNARERKVIELRCGLQGERPWTCEQIGRHV